MHEYGWKIEYALQVPLAQAFAFYAATSARYGVEPTGPTYVERAMLDALR